MFNISTNELGHFDVAVCGGGVAGVGAAVSAARAGANVILIEKSGTLGGTLTEGLMPQLIDNENKGGVVKELYNFLNERNMTIARYGKRIDDEGKNVPGRLVDTEACKYFFDKICTEAGVKMLFHSQVAAINMDGDMIDGIFLATECGNYSLTADVYIDATGNGIIEGFAGCEWDCGDPVEKNPSPTSYGIYVMGMPDGFFGTDTPAAKTEYNNLLAENNIKISAEQMSATILPSQRTWSIGSNFQYGVMPDDIETLTRAVLEGRRETFETIEAHKKIEGYEKLAVAFSNSHIGVREGRRIYGEYRLTDEDILSGSRFDDGICLVRFGVDVHKLKSDDTTDCMRGYRTQPYHIPYRCLLPKAVSNMLLAGRCISGDFYPHSSYRVMGNMVATGEAAGFAAAKCSAEKISPKAFDGRRARDFMAEQGYEL